MTAIEMQGVSLTLLPLVDKDGALFDDPTDVPVWPGDGRIVAERKLVATQPPPEKAPAAPGPLTASLRNAAMAVADALEKAESELAELDSRSGDGDLGASMVRAASAILALPADSYATPARLLLDLGNALRRAIAGSSGPFYATALLRAATKLEGKVEPSWRDWADAFEAGAAAVTELGGAKLGDRTMVDALAPAIEAWRRSGSFVDAVAAAEAGAEATADMLPSLGRASYLGSRALGVPDGGARAVAIWMRALLAAR